MANTKYEKSPLVIPVEFVEKVLSIITDEAFNSVAKKAQETYNAPVESWFTGWWYQFSRLLGPKLEAKISAIEKNHDYYERLVQIKELMALSKWKTTSFNYSLFVELIKSIPQYKSLEGDTLSYFVYTLRDEVLAKVDGLINEYNHNLEVTRRRSAEKEQISANAQRRAEETSIFSTLQEAQNEAKSKKNKIIFCLTNDSEWKLALVDTEGRAHDLELTEELYDELTSKNIADIQKLKPVHLSTIKRQCHLATEKYLTRIHLRNNPEETNLELSDAGITSTFILRQTPEGNTLWWANSLGNIIKVDLESHPEIETLLETEKPLKNECILKFHLLTVDVSRTINENRKKDLNDKLAERFKEITSGVKTEDAKKRAVSLLRVMFNPEQNNAELSSSGTCSTFILRQSGKKFTLWWANSLAVINKIDLRDYPDLYNWLSSRSLNEINAIAEELNQLKSYLFDVDVSKAIDPEKTNKLSHLLAAKFEKINTDLKAHKQDEVSPELAPLPEPVAETSITKASVTVETQTMGSLAKERYNGLANLHSLWQRKQAAMQEAEQEAADTERLAPTIIGYI